MRRDFLEVIEAGYDMALDPALWLERIARAVYDQIGAKMGMSAFYYEVTEDHRLRIGQTVEIDLPDQIGATMRGTLESMPPEFVRGSFVRCEATTQSQVEDPTAREMGRQSIEVLSQMFGWRDALMMGGMDPTRHGVYVGAWLAEETKLAPRQKTAWTRVAVHAVTAYRLRRRLAEISREIEAADAILTPSGRVEHVRSEAGAPDARANLVQAVREVERARGRLRKDEPEQAVSIWKGLVSGRWTLLDHFETDGKRYVIARRNDVAVPGTPRLTDRERQAVGYAALGHTNKLIAYEMGISSATVGVLLHRAARKLGTRTREELVAAFSKTEPRV